MYKETFATNTMCIINRYVIHISKQRNNVQIGYNGQNICGKNIFLWYSTKEFCLNHRYGFPDVITLT